MAKTKYQLGRLRIIDREFQRRERVKSIDLKKIIEKELDIKVDIKTIQNDIKLLQHDSIFGYYAPIERDEKTKSWFYTDRTYTIGKFKLKDDEINILKISAQLLGTYKNHAVFSKYSDAIDKILNAVRIQEITNTNRESKITSLMHIEEKPPTLWSEYLTSIITALEENRKLQCSYHKHFDECPKERLISPYLLKEYHGRWYLLGKLEDKDHIVTFALDNRMLEVSLTNDYFERENIDFDNYFKYSLGVIVPEMSPIDVVLSFSPKQGKYIKSLPIHGTQKILNENEEEFRISLSVKPSYEFYEKILSYGKSVTVISPDSVREHIIGILEESLKNY